MSRDSRSFTSGGFISGESSCSPSGSINTASQGEPLGILILAIFLTVPDTEECTGADTNAVVSAITCPTSTRSPAFTHGTHGAPICC